MIFGGLSEKELVKISSLLKSHSIIYNVVNDELVNQSNNQSMGNNLRHLNPPSISTNILAIEISDDAFLNMNSELRSALLDFGITDIAPEDFGEIDTQDLNAAHNDMLAGNRKVVGFNFIHQIIVVMIVAALGYLLSKL